MRPCATMPKEEDASKRAKKIGSDRYEKSEKRKESRKKWQQTHEHNTNHTNSVHRVRKHNVPPPEGKVCTTQIHTANKYPAPDESKRELHKPCGGGSSAPSLKVDNVCSRQPEPIRTSDPRGYNTGNVPPSYGLEDGNLFTTKKPSR